MLGTHYYPWYGKPANPILGGGDWSSGYTDHPILGKYDSRDHAVINQHIKWAKSAGIDFFSMEWTGPHTWEDITLKNYYLSAPKAQEIKFCIFYDSYFTLNKFGTPFSYNFNDRYTVAKTKGQKFLEDFEYLAGTYFNSPRYLRIDNRPLVIVYISYLFQNASSYLEQLETIMAKKGYSLFLVADVVYFEPKFAIKEIFSIFGKEPLINVIKGVSRKVHHLSLGNLRISKYFDAVTGYNMYRPERVSNFLEDVDREYRKFWDYARSRNLRFIPTVMPGYDDRNLRGSTRPILGREKGEFYKEFWKVAKKYIDPSLKIVLITSFNEWHEGTEIEPSKEYGNTYLELTEYFSTELKGEKGQNVKIFKT